MKNATLMAEGVIYMSGWWRLKLMMATNKNTNKNTKSENEVKWTDMGYVMNQTSLWFWCTNRNFGVHFTIKIQSRLQNGTDLMAKSRLLFVSDTFWSKPSKLPWHLTHVFCIHLDTAGNLCFWQVLASWEKDRLYPIQHSWKTWLRSKFIKMIGISMPSGNLLITLDSSPVVKVFPTETE